MKRVLLFAACLACLGPGLLTACPPTAQPMIAPSCRESDGPALCKPPTEIGSHQGAFLEGEGLERMHFTIPAGAFPPPPGTKLVPQATCGARSGVTLSVLGCVPVTEPHGPGAYACQVDVDSSSSGIIETPPRICVTTLGGRIADPDPSRHRGVTVVRGLWDGTGAWHDEPNSVTLSCDAAANDEGTEQFVQADGAITKCLRSFQISPQLFGDAFLACIRMVRADYCGDGHPHTYTGTEVGVATPQSPMTSSECKDGRCFEASWSRDGAVCVARPRWTGSGMDFAACRDQFTPSGALQCRADPRLSVVFSRSKQYVCGEPAPTACPGPDLDPVCRIR